MSNRETFLQKIEDGHFSENNRHILSAIDMLPGKFIRLSDILYVYAEMGEDGLVQSVDYLVEQGYVHLQNVFSKKPDSFTDASPKELEAKLTGKGIQLLRGFLKDPAILPLRLR